ncbi:proteasome-activating ATPase [Aureococcus anophagefferens]|nr:proteasome-activating ATPase [Aureococcus anophagefferens]
MAEPERGICVFDLDHTLLHMLKEEDMPAEVGDVTEDVVGFSYQGVDYSIALRVGTTSLVSELQKKGIDVAVATCNLLGTRRGPESPDTPAARARPPAPAPFPTRPAPQVVEAIADRCDVFKDIPVHVIESRDKGGKSLKDLGLSRPRVVIFDDSINAWVAEDQEFVFTADRFDVNAMASAIQADDDAGDEAVDRELGYLTNIREAVMGFFAPPTIDWNEGLDSEPGTPREPRPERSSSLEGTYGNGPYTLALKKCEDDIKKHEKKVKDLIGIKDSDTGLCIPSQWDLVSDKQTMQEEQPLQVARCTKIIDEGNEDCKYVINVKQIAKFVVGLGEKVAPTDVEEGMRVGVDRTKYAIQIPLPPKIDPTVSLMTVEDKPDVTYDEVGGAKESLEKLREVVELPLLHPERFLTLGIDPPKGVLLYGPPGTGKTLSARAKYVGEGARMVRELFTMARSKKACIIFFDEVDAIGGSRTSGDGDGGSDNEVQRTMLQIVTELDGFDPRGNIKVLMATNRPDTLDPALLRPGRLDRKVEFGLPDLEGRTHILKIHAKTMAVDADIRYELLARLCPNTTGAELRSVCTEAGMFAIRGRRKSITEKDMIDAVKEQQDPHIACGHARFALFLAQAVHLPVEDAAQAFEVEEVSASRSRGGKGCVSQSMALRVP